MKTDEYVITEGVDYYNPVKMRHKGFYLATFKRLMKEWSGGSYLVMKIIPIIPGDIPIFSIRYRYNSRKVLIFVAAEGSVSNKPGDTYLSISPKIILTFLFTLFFSSCDLQVFQCP